MREGSNTARKEVVHELRGASRGDDSDTARWSRPRRFVLKRFGREQSGLSLVETLVAIGLFSILTIGILPLLLGSLRAAVLAQTNSIGKEVASGTLERARGLPYFVSFAAKNQPVDVLDLYFPQTTGVLPGQSYSGGVFTTTCTQATDNPACPANIPELYTVKIEARFVEPVESGGTETFSVVTPPVGYAWNSLSGSDLPPSQLLQLDTIVEWSLRDEPRTLALNSIVGDRKFSELAVAASGKVNSALQVITSYKDLLGRTSNLTASMGKAESATASRILSEAAQTVEAGDMTLTLEPCVGPPGCTGEAVTLDFEEGAKSSHLAPPDAIPAGASAGGKTITYPGLISDVLPTDVAFLDTTTTSGLQVKVAGELPVASGMWSFAGTGQSDFWVDNQSVVADALRLDPTKHVLSVRKKDGTSISGGTSSTTKSLQAGDRGVESTATTNLGDVRLLPTTFAVGPLFERAVILIEDFTATTTCKSTAAAPTASASATWTANLRYWRDEVNDGIPAGSFQSVALSGALGADPLQAIKASNPLVYDGLTPVDDIYLFDDPALGRIGYLTDWSSNVAPTSTVGPEGRSTQASIPGAIRITTAPTILLLPESGFNISIGNLSCTATDMR